MLKLLLLSGLLVDLSYATISCHEVQQSHLASLHERMNQMLSTLYSSPLLPKTQEASQTTPSTPKPETSPPYETPCYQPYTAPVPPVIFIAPQAPPTPSPSPSYYGHVAGMRPMEYAYPQAVTPQPTWNYDQYYQQYYQPSPVYPPAPYSYPPHHCETSYPYPPEYPPSYRPPYPQPYAIPYPTNPAPYLPPTYQRPNEIPPPHYA